MQIQQIIHHKRECLKLTEREIDAFVQGVNDWSVSDGQIAAMMMALLINGVDVDELTAFIRAIVGTGLVIDWSQTELNGPVVNLSAMAGVGDKLEIIAAPLLAACGAYVPMISDRMQYHAGGTLDKLEGIKGFSSRPSVNRFKRVLQEAGCAFMTPSEEIVPADSRIQSIRDVSATVNSIPLMIMSLLSKKIAGGADNLTLDIKVGNGAFTQDRTAADACADLFEKAAAAFNVKTSVTFSQMDYVTGTTVGNALEVWEATNYLTASAQNRNPDIHQLVMRVCATALLHNNLAASERDAVTKLEDALNSGRAAEQFGRMLTAQGVSAAFLTNPEAFLPSASVIRPIYPEAEGYVESINLRWLGLSLIEMGGGHLYLEHKIDYAAGYSNLCRPGMFVSPRTPLAFVHANDVAAAEEAAVHLRGAVKISETSLPKTWVF